MLADLLSECFAAEFKECWERERTATPVRAFAVRRLLCIPVNHVDHSSHSDYLSALRSNS